MPFTPFAGLLEWVEQTLPLGDYLMGPGGTRTGGAHARFRGTKDWGFMKCYEQITTAKPEQRLAVFQRVSLSLGKNFFLEGGGGGGLRSLRCAGFGNASIERFYDFWSIEAIEAVSVITSKVSVITCYGCRHI